MQKPQNTKVSEVRLNAHLISDRQWKREHRISWARLMLKYAWALADTEERNTEVAFWRRVLKENGV